MRNPLTQPISVKEFAEIGFHLHIIQAVNKKLADIKKVISPIIIQTDFREWYD
jgi:hypothetical protein